MTKQSLKLQDTIRKNKIASVTIYACPAEYGQLTGKRFKKTEVFYDKSGNEIEHLEYKRGQIEKWEKFKYDNKKRLIEKTRYRGTGYNKDKFKPNIDKFSYDNIGQLITPYKTITELDKDGNKVDSTFYLNSKIRSRRYFFNNGICKEEVEYQKEVITRRKNFDNNGNLLTDFNFDTHGNQTNYTMFEYDSFGNKIRIKKVSRTGHISQDRTLSYDKNNNLIEDFDIPKASYKIHENTNLELLESEPEESYRHNYDYNENQLLVSHRMYLVNELIMVYNYEYKHRTADN